MIISTGQKAGLIFFALLVLGWQGFSQPFHTRVYTANDGLPDSYTHGIFQDKQKYLWIGSYTGLSRFDGQKFTVVSSPSFNKGTSGNLILHDDLDRRWVTVRKTIGILRNDSIIAYPISGGQNMDYIFGAVQLRDKRIWGLSNNGIFEFTKGQWQKIQLPSKYNSLPCRQVIEKPEGLYINFGYSITLWQKNGKLTDLVERTRDQPFFITLQSAGNNLYVNTATEMFIVNGNRLRKLFAKQLESTINYNFLVDSKNRCWVSTEKHGILVSDPYGENELKYQVSLPFNLSTYIMEDSDGNIWATNYEGLVKITEVPFTIYNKTNGALYDNVRHLAIDPSGNLYIAASGAGLYIMSPGSPRPIKLLTGKYDMASEVIDGIGFKTSKELWIITRSRKLLRYDGHNTVDLADKIPAKELQLLYAVSPDNHTGKVLLASDKLYIGNENGFMSWGDEFRTGEIPNPRFITQLQDGRIMITTRDSGLYIIRNRIATRVTKEFQDYHFSRDSRVYEDPDSGIWLMNSAEGIIKFNTDKSGKLKRVASISTKDGLPNNYVVSACFDNAQQLWIATLSGLAIITKAGADGEYRVNTIGKEMGDKVLNWGSSAIVRDGQNKIWISTFHELIQFDPQKIQLQRTAPEIAIEKVNLFMKETRWTSHADSFSGYFQIPYKPILKAWENSMSISFRGISFASQPSLQYSYFLASNSADSIWSEPSPGTEVSFLKLPPGHYDFNVRVRQTGTDWSKAQTFSFIIKKPFWATWFFRVLILAIIVAALTILSRYRINRVRRKAYIQQQLHELEMKALKAQMNPHFIFNALNSIQSLVADNKQQEALRYISKFAKLLRQVLEQSDNHLVSLEKELATLDLYIQLEMLRMNMQLEYVIHLDDQLIPEKEMVPPLILQPFVENALWHGLHHKNGLKRLFIKISADEEWLYARIEDNGLGRKEAAALKKGTQDYPRSMGMEITSKRLQTINAGKDENLITILDLEDTHGLAAGTVVEVKIKRTPV